MVSVAAAAATQSPSPSDGATVLLQDEEISELMLGRILSDAMQVSGSSSDASVVAQSPLTTPAESVVTAVAKPTSKRPPAKKKPKAAKQPPAVVRRGNKTPPPSRSHTRSSGDAQLLTGVTHTIHSALKKAAAAAAAKPSAVHRGNAHGHPVVTDKGILTTRNGLPVTKVPMNTGTLYIYTGSRQAEFVRTK
jgi:hypothetical protein